MEQLIHKTVRAQKLQVASSAHVPGDKVLPMGRHCWPKWLWMSLQQLPVPEIWDLNDLQTELINIALNIAQRSRLLCEQWINPSQGSVCHTKILWHFTRGEDDHRFFSLTTCNSIFLIQGLGVIQLTETIDLCPSPEDKQSKCMLMETGKPYESHFHRKTD